MTTTPTTQREADERALFEEWAREACHMPDYAAVNWQAEWTLAAWEGFKAGRASLTPTAPQAAPFPERDLSQPAEQQGLFRKFDVRRVDGSDQPGGKHHGCRYYVLDLNHDQHAPAAMRAYAAACRPTHPKLADDIEAEFGAPQAASQQGDSKTCPDDIHVYTTSGNTDTCMFCEKQWERAPQAATKATCQPSTLTGQPDATICQPAATTASADPEGDFAKGMLIQLSRMGATPAALSLAVQLFGVGPCEKCGYRKLHCRCVTEVTTASASEPQPRQVQPYTVGELLGLYDTCKGDWCAIARAVEKYYMAELDAIRAALARAPLPAKAEVLPKTMTKEMRNAAMGAWAITPGFNLDAIYAALVGSAPVQAVDVARDAAPNKENGNV